MWTVARLPVGIVLEGDRQQPPRLLWILIAIVPAVSGTARGLVVPGLKLSDVLVLVLVLLVLVRWRLGVRLLDPLGCTLAIYAAVYAATTYANFLERPGLENGLLFKEAVAVPQYLLLYAVVFTVSYHSGDLRAWIYPSLVVAALVGLVAVLQFFEFPGVRAILTAITGNTEIVQPLDWKGPARATGPFFSWHALGMYLAVHAALAFAVLFRSSPSRRVRWAVSFCLLFIVLGIAAALTSTPILIMAVVLFVLYGRSVTAKVAIAVAAFSIAACVYLLTPFGLEIATRLTEESPEGTFAYRIMVWTRDFLPLVEAHPWDGYGPFGVDDRIFPYPESMYIYTLMAGGVLLFASFVAFSVYAIFAMLAARRLSKAAPLVRAVGTAMAIIMTLLLVAQVVHPYLADAGGAEIIFISLAAVAGQASRERIGRPRIPDDSVVDRSLTVSRERESVVLGSR
jgi:O-antigen ligase